MRVCVAWPVSRLSFPDVGILDWNPGDPDRIPNPIPKFGIPDFGIWHWNSRYRDWGLKLMISGFGIWIKNFGIWDRDSGLEFRMEITDFGIRDWDLGSSITRPVRKGSLYCISSKCVPDPPPQKWWGLMWRHWSHLFDREQLTTDPGTRCPRDLCPNILSLSRGQSPECQSRDLCPRSFCPRHGPQSPYFDFESLSPVPTFLFCVPDSVPVPTV